MLSILLDDNIFTTVSSGWMIFSTSWMTKLIINIWAIDWLDDESICVLILFDDNIDVITCWSYLVGWYHWCYQLIHGENILYIIWLDDDFDVIIKQDDYIVLSNNDNYFLIFRKCHSLLTRWLAVMGRRGNRNDIEFKVMYSFWLWTGRILKRRWEIGLTVSHNAHVNMVKLSYNSVSQYSFHFTKLSNKFSTIETCHRASTQMYIHMCQIYSKFPHKYVYTYILDRQRICSIMESGGWCEVENCQSSLTL
jgi:hypothetical protein